MKHHPPSGIIKLHINANIKFNKLAQNRKTKDLDLPRSLYPRLAIHAPSSKREISNKRPGNPEAEKREQRAENEVEKSALIYGHGAGRAA